MSVPGFEPVGTGQRQIDLAILSPAETKERRLQIPNREKTRGVEIGRLEIVAEGAGFEPAIPVSQDKRLAGARTRPLCDPSKKRIFTIAE